MAENGRIRIQSSRGERGVTWGVSGVKWRGMGEGAGRLAESTGRGPQDKLPELPKSPELPKLKSGKPFTAAGD